MSNNLDFLSTNSFSVPPISLHCNNNGFTNQIQGSDVTRQYCYATGTMELQSLSIAPFSGCPTDPVMTIFSISEPDFLFPLAITPFDINLPVAEIISDIRHLIHPKILLVNAPPTNPGVLHGTEGLCSLWLEVYPGLKDELERNTVLFGTSFSPAKP